ncbi:PBP1A family penicillin-binding protein [Virgibacillus sp. W0181]|uniref:transglycosylase domain-containing protein n=1 Tax=Virgibacillus sp. W0181 TaxID=3391581 RepID=UPI003F45F6BC
MDEFHEEEPKTRSERHQKTFIQKFKKWITFIGIICILLLTMLTVIIYGGKLIVKEENMVLPATSAIETEDGEVLWELYEQYRKPVPLSSVPEHVREAFIAIEDRRFYSHSGVDFKSVIRAIYRDIVARSKVEGGSTITQQLAKNLFLSNDKTWLRKTKEVMAAIYLEREYTKEKILELYMNTIYFGQGVYGVEAAAERYFSKSAQELSVAEGALLAGLAKAPNSYSPVEYPDKAQQRRDVVLSTMTEVGAITETEKTQAQESDVHLNIPERKRHPSIDSYIDLVLNEAAEKYELTIEEVKRGGYRFVVAMDPLVQRIAYEQMQKDDYFSGNSEGVEGAFVLMNQKNGSIVSAIGGRNYQFGDLNRLNVKRQPGSTMKPIAVYGPAMMEGSYAPYSLIPDQLVDRDGYLAKNNDNQYAGAVSIYEAITLSKNAPAVWLLENIGIDYAKNYLKKMNINIEDNGLAIALGGLKDGLTPVQITEAYRTFASAGEYTDGYTIVEIYDRNGEIIAQANQETKVVFNEQTAWNMTEMLKNVVENGTAKKGTYHKELAGKTGSTEHPHVEGNYKDAWFAGYTPEYVFALWMGYDSSDQDHYLTKGSESPTILMKKILTEMDQKRSLKASFTKPDNVQAVDRPIELPEINSIKATYTFGGRSILRGKLTWDSSTDDRVVYRIYKEKDGVDERIGEVTGENEFIIENIALFKKERYYIVPYDPLTKMEGTHSDVVELKM